MKRSEQTVELNINVAPEAAWNIISALTGVEKWLNPVIVNSRVEGDHRICSIDGGEFTEDIISVDHDNMLLQYGIPEQPMMPVENIIGSMKVIAKENNTATIRWHWAFEVANNENEAQAKEMLAGVGTMGIKGIEKLVQNEVTA